VTDAPRSNALAAFVRLARPKQWAKSVFVFIGPIYGLADKGGDWKGILLPACIAALAFALMSSACYIVNDIMDVERDRLHPRKKLRPLASGAVRVSHARIFAVVLMLLAVAAVLVLRGSASWWVGTLVLLYAINTNAYSLLLKRLVIADVMSLSMGFVLRVLAGCGAAAVAPSTWLLNCTLFLAMFLAFGKRLGERRTMAAAGVDAAAARSVQSAYTDDLLRMAVVVTGVATLVIYAAYVQSRDSRVMASLAAAGFSDGGWFNLLWLTMLPATYGLLRCIVLLERGRYDDPTELVAKDWPARLAGLAFAAITLAVAWIGFKP
jgi:4-hydroxybenzoate polyprenyltransferase